MFHIADVYALRRQNTPRVLTMVVAFTCMACGERAMTKGPDRAMPSPSTPLFAIVSDPASVREVPASGRQAEMRKTFEEIISRLPEEQREGARRELEVGWVGRPLASQDPEIARLWGRILSLRAAMHQEAKPIQRGVVRVALVKKLDDPTFRAVVVRRADDDGIPLLLLPAEAATGEDLFRGLQAASRSLGYEPQPGKQTTIAVKYGGKRQEPTQRRATTYEEWNAALVQLRASPEVQLQGYGMAPLMIMSSIAIRPK